MGPLEYSICAAVAVATGAAGWLFARSRFSTQLVGANALTEQLKKNVEQLENQSRTQADTLVKQAELKAREEYFKKQEALNREHQQKLDEIREAERKIEKRESLLEKTQQSLLKKERHVEHHQKKLAEKRETVEKQQAELERITSEQLEKLHQLSGMSREHAEKELLERLERHLAQNFAERIHKHEEKIKSESDERARKVLAMCVQRYAASHTADTTVSTVDIPSDDMKGRIIGREGRNIRAFEKATGVDVIVDDTPGVVIVSAFDNVRRETARLSLIKLIQDGRIHPSRIEEVVKETTEAMEKHILEVGRNAALDVGVPNIHDKILQLLGRLKFRTSYTQNVLQHSLEVAHLTGMLADEMGLDGALARRCGLLHDIGKAADHEMEGGHPQIGADLAKRYGETNRDVLHAILGHHDDITIDHVYTVLVATADAISASRPGARRETLEKYVKRLEQLEAVAHGFPGVDQAFAIQAGRELRVIANASRTTDAEATKIAHDIARAIEEQMDYPGEIKVTVIRETRTVEMAR